MTTTQTLRRIDATTFEADSTSSEHRYRIQVSDDGSVAVCNCPGYETHGRCWHVEQATAQQRRERGASTALVPIAVNPPQAPLPTRAEMDIMGTLARSVIQARGHAVPASLDTPGKAFAVLLAGWELGVKPMVALRHIFVVNGRTEPDAQLLMGMVLSSDPTAQFVFEERSARRCCVSLYRRGRLVVRSEYTIEDAERSGQLAKGGVWKQYTRDMLAWAAVKRACRLGAPEVINQVSLGMPVVEAEPEPAPTMPADAVTEQAVQEPLPPESAPSPSVEEEPLWEPSASFESAADADGAAASAADEGSAEDDGDADDGHDPDAEDELDALVDQLRAALADYRYANGDLPITDKQLNMLKGHIDRAVGKEHRQTLVQAVYGTTLEALTRAMAGTLIDWLGREGSAGPARRLVARAAGQQELV